MNAISAILNRAASGTAVSVLATKGEGAGTLVVGGTADLVVWSGDPLDVGTWAERVMIDGVWHDLKPGDVVLVPPSIRHQYRNAGDTTFKFLCGIPVDEYFQKEK